VSGGDGYRAMGATAFAAPQVHAHRRGHVVAL